MKYNFKIFNIITLFSVFLILANIRPQTTLGACEVDPTNGPDPMDMSYEFCASSANGGSYGRAVYSCGTYPDSFGGSFYGCYHHTYTCDSSCSAGGGGGGGGGGEGQATYFAQLVQYLIGIRFHHISVGIGELQFLEMQFAQ